MALVSLGILSLGILKESAKYMMRPKRSRITSGNPPYDKLCISAILSRLAYKSRSEFKEATKLVTHKFPSLESSFEQVIFENDTDLVMLDGSKKQNDDGPGTYQDTQAFAWFRNGHAYVVFRGTESKKDILSDIDVRRSKFGKHYGALVHNGFLQQFNAIEDELTAYLESHRKEYTDITFIGHSLGSACAILASLFYAEHFKYDCVPSEAMTIDTESSIMDTPSIQIMEDKNEYENKPLIIHCHGFGGPRVGNECFAKFFRDHKILSKNTWQIRQFEDVVPMIPLSFRFCHVPTPTLYFHKGKVHFNEQGTDNPWFLRPFILLTKINVFNITKPHDLDNYIESTLFQYKDMNRGEEKENVDIELQP